MDKIITHRRAINKIAADLGVPKEKVESIVNTFFTNLPYYCDGTNAIKMPYIGALVPDMRAHRHLKEREKRVEWIAYNRRKIKDAKKEKEKREKKPLKKKKCKPYKKRKR